MLIFPSFFLISSCLGAHQYSGDQTKTLYAGSLDTEIFGTSGKQVDGGYGSGHQIGALSEDVNVPFQVIKESNKYPNDYVPEAEQQVVEKKC